MLTQRERYEILYGKLMKEDAAKAYKEREELRVIRDSHMRKGIVDDIVTYRYGVKPKETTEDKKKKIKTLLDSGLTRTQISVRLGIKKNTLDKQFKRYGFA